MKNQRFIDRFSVIFSSIVLLIFVFIFFQFAINVPKWDDFAFIKFIADFNETDSFVSKFDYLFKQHNEHRLVTTRFVALLDYYLFGKLNFVHLMIAGNIGLIVIVYLFFRQTRKIEILFPLSVLWLNTSFYENLFWGMASFQNFWVVLFVICGIYLLVHKQLNNMFAWLFIPLLSILTSGNGLLILPLIGVYYLFEKQKSRFITWVLYSVLLLSIYFISYQKPPDALSEGFYLKSFTQGVLYFLGSAFEGVFWGAHMFQVITCIGFLLSVGSVFLSLKFLIRGPKKSSEWFFILISGFVLATAFIVAFNRVGQFQAHSMLVSRYKIYSVLLVTNFIVLCYQVLLPSRFVLTFRVVIFSSSLIYYLCIQHYFIGSAVSQKQYLQSFLYNWTQHKLSNVYTNYYEVPKDDILRFSYKHEKHPKGIYQLSNSFLKSEIDLTNMGVNSIRKPYLFIHNEQHSFLTPYSIYPKTGFRSLVNYNVYFKPKAKLEINLNNLGLPSGTYTISLYQPGESLATIGTALITSASQVRIKQNW